MINGNCEFNVMLQIQSTAVQFIAVSISYTITFF